VRKLAIAASALLLAATWLNAQQQALEVQQSNGFVEALLQNLGWRQAVIGRQLPAGAVVTSWVDASAKLGYGDSVVSVEQLTHLTVLDVGTELVRLSLESGGIRVEAAAIVYEVQFRGIVVRIEKGVAVLNDGVLKVEAGNVAVNGAQDSPLVVPVGSSVSLISSSEGPLFPALLPGP
jgi:hypothetical protein